MDRGGGHVYCSPLRQGLPELSRLWLIHTGGIGHEATQVGRQAAGGLRDSYPEGETSVAEAARQHGLTVAEVEDWREKFLLGAENALRARPKDDEALKDEQVKKLKQKIGELVLDNDILREALKPYPLDRKTSDA